MRWHLKRAPSSRKRPRTPRMKGPNRWTVMRKLRHAKGSALRPLGLRCRVLPFLGMPRSGVPKRACHHSRQGPTAASPSPQGYGGPQAYQATRPLYIVEEGPCDGKCIGVPPPPFFVENLDAHLFINVRV